MENNLNSSECFLESKGYSDYLRKLNADKERDLLLIELASKVFGKEYIAKNYTDFYNQATKLN